MRHYASLAVKQPPAHVLSLVQAEQRAALDDPATAIFTDLRVAPSVVVPAGESLDDSLRLMQLAGVRMAFVVDTTGGVIGLVTAADLQDERAMRAASSRMVSHEDLTVADVMTPAPQWVTLDHDSLRRACVGDVIATFNATGVRYLIVTEPAPAEAPGRAVVRGVFSANRAERALGRPIAEELRSRSFSDLAAALAHN